MGIVAVVYRLTDNLCQFRISPIAKTFDVLIGVPMTLQDGRITIKNSIYTTYA